MPDPINPNPPSDPVTKTEDDYSNPYDDLGNYQGGDFSDDFGFGDGSGGGSGAVGGSGDEFVGGDSSGGASGPSDMSPNGCRYWLNDLKNQGVISQAQFDAYTAQINAAPSLPGPAQDAALAKIVGDVNNVLSPPAPSGGGDGLGDIGVDPSQLGEGNQGGDGSLSSEIQTFIDGINANKTLDPDMKTTFIQQANDLMGQVTVAGTNEDALAPLEQKFSDLQSSYQNFLAMPPNASKIAKDLKIDPTTLMSAAEAHGIDLNKLPDPPTAEFMSFLEDLNPDIKKKIDAIKSTHDQKMAEVDKKTTEAQAISDNNVNNGTTDNNDNKDFSAHQFLYDAKYLQTSYDKKIRELSEGARDDIITMLKSFYPDTKVSKVSPDKIDQVYAQGGGGGSDPNLGTAVEGAAIGSVVAGPVGTLVGAAIGGGIFGGTSVWSPSDHGTGWMEEANRHIAADKIQFGDVTLDFISGKTGEIQASTTPDSLDENIKIVAVQYDGEGDGEWEPNGINTYGDPTVPHGYDPDEGGASLPW
jgi:hypothetical protein